MWENADQNNSEYGHFLSSKRYFDDKWYLKDISFYWLIELNLLKFCAVYYNLIF